MPFLLRRAVHGALLLLGVSFLAFALMELAPGDYFSGMRLNPEVSPAALAVLRAHYGLDRPLPLRYARWLASAARGEFGVSFAYNMPAGALLWRRSANTLLLTATATALAWLIAIPLGVWSADRRARLPDRLVLATETVFLTLPDLLLATALLYLALRTGWLPVGGMLLAVTALVVGALPWLLRHVRASVAELLDAPFVRAARAHGIPRRRLLFRHVLPAAANPLISLFGLSIAGLLSSSLLIEVVMGWPGLGPLLVEALAGRDIYVVIGAVVFSAAFLIAGNLAADALLYLCDPRIRAERT